MNRRLGGDASLNAPLREEGDGEWQDWLVDESASQETVLADREESDARLDGAEEGAARAQRRASAASSRRAGSPTTR